MGKRINPIHPIGGVDPTYLANCERDKAWCAKVAKTKLAKMSIAELKELNCGKPIKPICKEEIEKISKSCIEITPYKKKKAVKREDCYYTRVVFRTMKGCNGIIPYNKRAGKIGADKSDGLELYLGIGALLFILIGGALAAYFYMFGGKKDGKAAKGASKTSKSKSKLAGKSKIGSRKSQASKRSSRKGSQRSKLSKGSQSKGKGASKSRVSGTKKK